MSPFFNQSDVNLDPMATGRLAFSRTSGSLRLSTQISDWFLVILPFFLIGFFEYLAFCYKKLDRKAFKAFLIRYPFDMLLAGLPKVNIISDCPHWYP